VNPNNLHTRLESLELDPPEMVWEQVSMQIETPPSAIKLQEYQMGMSFQQMELQPPAEAWQNIVAQLDEQTSVQQQDTKVVTMPGKKAPVISIVKRLAVAAAIVAIGMTTYFALNKPANDGSTTVANTTEPSNNQDLPKPTPKVELPKPADNLPKNEVASNDMPGKLNDMPGKVKDMPGKTNDMPGAMPGKQSNNNSVAIAPKKREKETVLMPVTTQPVEQNNIDLVARNQDGTVADPKDYVSTGYITTTGPNGQQVRVSSKLAAMFSDPSNTKLAVEPIDIMIMEGSKWRKIYNAWQDKINKSKIINSANAANLDILELLNLIQEKP
jgi:hypothetical protein